MTLNVQFLTMISMVSGGFYLGMILDTYRRFTKLWKNNLFLLYFMEICFWLTQTFILFYVLFRVNGGELRVYIFAACLLGFAIYQVVASKLYKRILERIINITTAICRFIARLIHAVIIVPIKFIFHILFICIAFIMKLIVTVLLFIFKILFSPIKWTGKKIYRMLPDRFIKFLHKLAGFYSTIKNIYTRCKKFIMFKRR